MAKSKTGDSKLSLRAKIGYGTIGLGSIGFTMMSTWQLFFFTTFAGINIATAGFIVSIGDICAAFIAPVWGYISDRMYRTKIGRKFGRRKTTLALTIPGLCILMVVNFTPGLPLPVYAICNFLYWSINAGFQTIQYVLPAEMTTDSDERAHLAGLNQITVAIATISLSIINAYLFTVWGDTSALTYTNMAILYAIVTAVMTLIAVFTIQEHPYDETTDFTKADSNNKDGSVPPLKRVALVIWNYFSAWSLREFRNYLGMNLSQILFRSVRSAILTYFLLFVLGLQSSDVSISQGMSFAFGIAFVMLFMWLNTKIGAYKSYRISAIQCIVTFLIIFGLVQIHDQIGHTATIVAWIALSIILNFGLTGVFNSCDFAYSFIPDVDEVLTGKRREGQYASINSTIDNVFKSLEAITVTGVLSAMGFVSGASSQPQNVINGLTIIFCFVPIVFAILGYWFSCRVKLNPETHAILMAEIKRLRDGGSKEDVKPEVKKVIEDLTGYKYEHCWGNNRVMNYSHKVVEEESTMPKGAVSDAS